MRLLLTGGGTAGHVNPALAIAQTFIERETDCEVLFVASCAPSDKAETLVHAAGYPFKKVHICGLHRPPWSPKNIKTVYLMGKSRIEAKKIIRDFKPDLIVGTGGYACLPVVSAGASMGIPTAVHESNAKPGKAIMQVRNKVDTILINFPQTADRLDLKNKNTRVARVGNPHMSGFSSMTRDEARRTLGLTKDQVYVVSFGGSGGAEPINDAVLDMMTKLGETYPSLVCLHAAGARDFDRVKQGFDRMPPNPRMRLQEYIYDMPVQMQAADIVVSRAGAMTISELALTGKAAIVIPSPTAGDAHQLKNAQVLSDCGAGVCIEEAELKDGALIEAVIDLMKHPQKRAHMGVAIRDGFAVADANERIYHELKRLCSSK